MARCSVLKEAGHRSSQFYPCTKIPVPKHYKLIKNMHNHFPWRIMVQGSYTYLISEFSRLCLLLSLVEVHQEEASLRAGANHAVWGKILMLDHNYWGVSELIWVSTLGDGFPRMGAWSSNWLGGHIKVELVLPCEPGTRSELSQLLVAREKTSQAVAQPFSWGLPEGPHLR